MPPERVCTECGWGTPGFKPARPWWPRAVLVGLPLFMVATVVFLGCRHSSSYTYGPARTSVVLMNPVVTRGELRALAAGEQRVRDGATDGLAARLLEQCTPSRLGHGNSRFQVALTRPPMGSDSRTVRIGWPYAWLTIHSQRYWKDVVGHTGLRTAVSRRPQASGLIASPAKETTEIDAGFRFWPGNVVWAVPPEQVGGASVTANATLDVAVSSLVCAALMFLVLRWVLRDQGIGSRTLRAARVVVPVTVGLLVIALPRDTGTYRWANYQAVAPRREKPATIGVDTALDPGTALTTRTLEEIGKTPPADADQLLAADILAVCRDTPEASPGDVLFASACIENWNIGSRSLDIFCLTRVADVTWIHHERCPDFGSREPVTMPETFRVSIDWEYLRVVRANGRTEDPTVQVGVSIAGLVAHLALVFVPGMVVSSAHRVFTRRRAAKRELCNECPACGYPIADTRIE